MSVSEQVGLPYGSRASSPGASLRRPFTPGGMFPSSASTAGDGRVSRSASTHGGGHGGFAPTALYHSSSTYSLQRPIEPGDRTGAVFTYSSSVLFYPLYIYLYICIYFTWNQFLFTFSGSSSHLPQFHLPTSRQRRSSSQAAAGSHLARFGGESRGHNLIQGPGKKNSWKQNK